MLTCWFTLNLTDPEARQYLYSEIPNYDSYDKTTKTWNRRQRSRGAIGRLYFVQPSDTERFALRLLLLHMRGATSFDYLRTTDDGVIYPTFQAAALARGLLQDDNEWDELLEEFFLIQTSARECRKMFVLILAECRPSSPLALWMKYRDELAANFFYQQQQQGRQRNEVEAYNLALLDLDLLLGSHGRSLSRIRGMPVPSPDAVTQRVSLIEQEQGQYNPDLLRRQLEDSMPLLNPEQRAVFDAVLGALEQDTNAPSTSKVFSLDGPGGTGKSFLYNVILVFVRSQSKIALAVASSGIAALLLHGGRTAHSQFGIPVHTLNPQSFCSIPIQSAEAELIRQSSVIIWDEAPMAHRYAVEAVDRFLRDLMGAENADLEAVPFGGKVVLFGGDFRQTLPVIQHGTKSQVLDACLKNSYSWDSVVSMRLATNMRVHQSLQNDPPSASSLQQFVQFLLQVGDGSAPALTASRDANTDAKDIYLPTGWCHTVRNLREVINGTWPDLTHIVQNEPHRLIETAILAPPNRIVDALNDEAINMLPGEAHEYLSVDTLSETAHENQYPPEYLNSIEGFGLQPHRLRLKVGQPVILIRNLNPREGLCNGTRLICRRFSRHLIEAEIAIGDRRGKTAHKVCDTPVNADWSCLILR